MKRTVKALIITIALILVSVLTACGISGNYEDSSQSINHGNASSSTQDGRYVETEWLVGRDMIDSNLPRITPQGDIALLISTADEWDNDPRQIQGLHEKDMRSFISNDGIESENAYFENILNTWQRNDKTFAVPLVFQLPAVNTFELPGGDIDAELYQSSDSIDYSKLEPSRFYAFDDDYIIPDECALE